MEIEVPGHARIVIVGGGIMGVALLYHLAKIHHHGNTLYPKLEELTGQYVSWLVDGKADVDHINVDRMIWMWNVTTRQDKVISVESIQAGINPAVCHIRNAAWIRSISGISIN